jgi:hypothetical protein
MPSHRYRPSESELDLIVRDIRRGVYSPQIKLEQLEKMNALRHRLEVAYHMTNHPKAAKMWDIATGFDLRLDEIVYLYDELYELIYNNSESKEKKK